MSRALPRPLMGLAATALAGGLLMLPMLAYADPTPTPSAKTSTAAPSATAPSTQARSTSAPSQRAADSASPSVTAESPTASTDPSDSASPSLSDESADPTSSPTPSADPSSSTGGRVSSDAVEAPSPSVSEAAPIQAQAAAPAAISLIKTASRASVSKVGQVIGYTFVARNTGGVELTDVAISDELEGLSELDCGGTTTLAVGTSLRCTASLTVTQDWLDFGSVDNSATVFASYAIPESDETDYVGANASAHVSVSQTPAISLKASVSPTGTVDAGDRLRYTATATNTGNVTLTSARITSSLSKLDLDCAPSARATLAPGESIDCDGSYKVTTKDGRRGKVTNKLTALANGPYDDQRPSDSVTLRSKVTKISSSSDSGLADTGGPGSTLPIGVLGLVALTAGAGLIRRSRRA